MEEDVEVGNVLNEDDVVEDDVDLVEVDLDPIDVNVGRFCSDAVVVDVDVLLDDVDVNDSPDSFVDGDEADVVVVNLIDVVVDDVVNGNVDDNVESYDVDDDSAVVVVDELFKGDVDDDVYDDSSDAVVVNVAGNVQEIVLHDVGDVDGGDDQCRND